MTLEEVKPNPELYESFAFMFDMVTSFNGDKTVMAIEIPNGMSQEELEEESQWKGEDGKILYLIGMSFEEESFPLDQAAHLPPREIIGHPETGKDEPCRTCTLYIGGSA